MAQPDNDSEMGLQKFLLLVEKAIFEELPRAGRTTFLNSSDFMLPLLFLSLAQLRSMWQNAESRKFIDDFVVKTVKFELERLSIRICTQSVATG